MNEVLTFLKSKDDYVKYNTLLHLEENDYSLEDKQKLKEELVFSDNRVQNILDELNSWPGPPLKTHKKMTLPIHRLSFLAEIGVDRHDKVMEPVFEKIFARQSEEGPFEILINIPKAFGGTGTDEYAWVLTNAPVIISALFKMGFTDDDRVIKALEYLTGRVEDYGWPCMASPKLGKFKGPGRKADPCPYATALMLKSLSRHSNYADSEAAHIGTETILHHWEVQKEKKFYMFGIGTDFKKLKAPRMWYDIVHIVDILSYFPWVLNDVRFQAMIEVIKNKADDKGLFTPESIYLPAKEWDFGQKKFPSRWLTYIVSALLKRIV